MKPLTTLILALGLPTLAGAVDSDPKKSAGDPEGFYVLMDRDPAELPDSPDIDKIKTIPVAENIYLLQGAFSNTSICIGEASVVMVDPGMPEVSDVPIAKVRALTDKPIDEGWGNPFVTGPFLSTIVYVSLTGSQ